MDPNCLTPGFTLVINIVAKCKEIINLAQKYQFGDNYWQKNITSENFCLALERHLRLKVIDLCRLMVLIVK